MPTPGAGAEAVHTVPGEWWEMVEAAAWQLVTSAAVATRVPSIRVQDPDQNTVYVGATGATQAASLTVVYGAGEVGGAVVGAAAARATLPLPRLWLPAGYRIVAGGAALDVADQVSQFRLLVVRRPRVEEIGALQEVGPGVYIEQGR